MAGLSNEGFIPLTLDEIRERIHTKLEAFSPGIDLSVSSPDGQLVEIFGFELAQAWQELGLVFSSYNPNDAIGAGLRNIGLISGLPYGAATRSQADIELIGVEGTVVPAGSIVSDAAGNEFATSFDYTISPSTTTVPAVAVVSGSINVDAGTITNIVTPVSGWTSINQPLSGRVGDLPQTETEYRNLRNRTVLRNSVHIEEVIKARINEDLGISQVQVLNNDTPLPLADGTPPSNIHVTVGEVPSNVTDEAIARVISLHKGLGTITYGSTSVTIDDSQGQPHEVKFTKATAKPVFMDIEVLFLDEDYAGAVENIRADLLAHISNLEAGEDLIWSRLFGIITPYSKAQVNKLELSTDGVTYNPSNIVFDEDEFAVSALGNINITAVN
jgi:uncharacterized phage protein gp47/JayE